MANGTLDRFCGSTFWNASVTWYTDNPDFTECFQQTVLVWIPCIFLWLFASLDVYYILHSKKRNIPWNFLNVSKLVLIILLIVLSAAEIVSAAIRIARDEAVYNVSFFTPALKVITYGLSAVLLVYNKKFGLQTSGLLFLFWLLVIICGMVQYRTELNKISSDEEIYPYVPFISYMIQYPVIIVIFALSCWADKEPKFSEYPKTEKPCPEQYSSFVSRILYTWFDPLAWRGFKRPLETSDLWSMKPEDCATEVVPQFDKYWDRAVEKYRSTQVTTEASYRTGANQVSLSASAAAKKHASILPVLCQAFGATFVFGSLLKLIQDILVFASPRILSLLISFTKNEDEPNWKGYLYVALLFLAATLQTLILAQYFNRMFIVGLRIRTALISAIYRKSLRMSNAARKESTVGEIVNLMAVDAQRFMDLIAYLNMIWSAPLQIALALYFLWEILGAAVFAGLTVMIILIPINGLVANEVKNLQMRQMKYKDERVKLMNEVLSGIKVLKLYAWEKSFQEQVLKVREKEIRVLKKTAYLNAATSFIWSCAPFVVSLVTFMTFVFMNDENVLDAEKAFVSLTYFNILRFPLSMLPMMISNMVQAYVSVQRINKFMNMPELNPDNVNHDPLERDPLIMENGTFSWGEDAILKNINIRIKQNSLVAVVGSVGSGKSSLVSAFLGEMDMMTGRVNTLGDIAYVSQQAWIQNSTLRNNILFGKEFDQKRYDIVIEACALKPDIEMLPGGDQTEIGEKGINLSGGQKQRVSLARAVYNDASVYFLDDPLSAVDSHVGKHIFEKVIGPSGLLGKKTRVLVTHGITYLPEVDNILVIKAGQVSETGTYKELLEKKGAFAEFLIQYLQEDIAEDVEDIGELDELKQTLSATTDPEEIRQKLVERQRSRISESVSESGSLERMNGGVTDTGEKSGNLRKRVESLSEAGSVMNGAVFRQQSVESGGAGGEKANSVRRRKTPEKTVIAKKKTVLGEKLIEDEKTETGSVKWEVYKHYLKSIGIFLAIATIVMNMVFQAFSIGGNIWLKEWSDDNESSIDHSKRDMYLGVYGALGVGQAFSSVFCDLFPLLGSWLAANAMHVHMLAAVMRAPVMFFDTTPLGRILSRFSKDVDVMDTGLPGQISDSIYCFFEVVATVVVISYTTPIFLLVVVPIGIIYYFVQRFYVATSRQLKRLESVSRSPIYSHFGESVTGTHIIRAYGVQKRFIRESEEKVDFNQVCYYPSIIANRWLAVRLEMVGNLIILFAALFAVLARDTVDPGAVGLSISYALQITQTLNWLVRMTSDVETNIVAVERIKEYGETPQEASWENSDVVPPKSWPMEGKVEFKDYSVRYRPGLDLVLKGISFTVNGGEKVGIVGRTGAGKSSLTLSLFRIIEAAGGSILIDSISISKLGLHSLRSCLTIIPQDPVLFSGTLRMNLDPFNSYSDTEVWRALEHAHLKSFVKELNAGLSHEVTEGGENLSVGQRQLICLARALLRKTKVLILDEATAAVDLETDDLIQQTIRTEFSDCTVLTIAHRLNTILDSDKVLVLDKGLVVEYEPPQRLLENKNSIFYGMAKDAGLV